MSEILLKLWNSNKGRPISQSRKEKTWNKCWDSWEYL